MNSSKNSRNVLLKILTIIDYQDDKEVFVKELLKLCIQKALLDMLSAAPNNDKQKITKLSEENLDPIELERKLKNIIGENIFNSSLEEAAEKIFSQYLKTIYPTLSTSQNKSLQLFLKSLN